MYRNSHFENRLKQIRFGFFAAVVLIALTAGARPVSATTYLFAIPTTTIQNSFASALTDLGENPQLYGFYDIYIRPALPADGLDGNNLPSYTASYDLSPIPNGPDAWSATDGPLDKAPFDTNLSFHFRFVVTDTRIALVSTNTNLNNGNTIDGRTSEQMPGTDVFKMFVTSASALLSDTINFYMTGTAYHFTNAGATGYSDKGSIVTANFSATGEPTPEPATAFGIGGGCLLLGTLLRRRNRARKNQS